MAALQTAELPPRNAQTRTRACAVCSPPTPRHGDPSDLSHLLRGMELLRPVRVTFSPPLSLSPAIYILFQCGWFNLATVVGLIFLRMTHTWRATSAPSELILKYELWSRMERLSSFRFLCWMYQYMGGCGAWFEELRKQRVTELRRELEKSESCIGSLQSKLESLSAGRQSEGDYECDTSHTESPSPNGNTADIDSSSKELSRDSFWTALFHEAALQGKDDRR